MLNSNMPLSEHHFPFKTYRSSDPLKQQQSHTFLKTRGATYDDFSGQFFRIFKIIIF